MTTKATEPDREPRCWTGDDQLAAKAAAAKPEHVVGRFVTKQGQKMAVIVAGKWPLIDELDATDFAMTSQGWDQLLRLIAFSEDDLRAYAVWEMYSRGEERVLHSKAIDVDCGHYNQGIGTGMRQVLVERGWTIAPSGSATIAGQGFIRSWGNSRGATAMTGDEEEGSDTNQDI